MARCWSAAARPRTVRVRYGRPDVPVPNRSEPSRLYRRMRHGRVDTPHGRHQCRMKRAERSKVPHRRGRVAPLYKPDERRYETEGGEPHD